MIYSVRLEDTAYYEIEADTEQEAIDQALEYWDERMPEATVETE